MTINDCVKSKQVSCVYLGILVSRNKMKTNKKNHL